MGRPRIETAAKLLAKAQSTTSESEALALLQRCYELIGDIINAADERNPLTGAPRRERRRVNDRRRSTRQPSAPVDGGRAARGQAKSAAGGYAQVSAADRASTGGVDVAL